VKSGDGQVISKRLQFVRVLPDGSATFAGWAPHLDLEPLARPTAPCLTETARVRAMDSRRAGATRPRARRPRSCLSISAKSPRRIAHVDKTLAAVHERLTKEIAYWSDRFIKLTDDKAAGKDVRLNLENVRRTLSDLEAAGESEEGTSIHAPRHVRHAGRAQRCAGHTHRLAAQTAWRVLPRC
jgi:hypothetical protein